MEHDDAVLIPDVRNPQTGMTSYLTRNQFQKKYNREPTKEELDQKAILIKSPSGTYLTKPATYQTTYGGDSTDPQVREAEKTSNFNARMDELGLSHKKFDGKHGERLTGKDAYIETPGGNRRKFGNYEHPEQAGVYSPDVLVKTKSGDYLALYPKAENFQGSLADLQKGHAEVFLKTKGHNYVSPETYELRNGTRQQEKAFAFFKGEPFHNERNDLPKALYRAGKGEYVSKEEFLAIPGNKAVSDGKIDYKQVDVLFQSPSGRSLLTPYAMRRMDPKGYDAFLDKEGIKPTEGERPALTTKIDRTRPQVLIAVKGRLISAEVARETMTRLGMDTSKPLAETFGANNVYVENVNKRGQATGNYRDAPSAQSRQPYHDNSRLEKLGVYKAYGQEKFAEMMKPGELFSKPNGAQGRGLGDRSRESGAAMELS